jgi:hypothetical protein
LLTCALLWACIDQTFLSPGTYWIELRDDPDFDGPGYADSFAGSLPGGAPRPLDGYYQYADDAYSWGWINRDSFGWGFRVSAVPEPATYAMLLAGLAVVFLGVRRAGPMKTSES